MSRKTTRRILNSEKIQLRNKQKLPEPVDQMGADVMGCDTSIQDPFSFTHMGLSLPVDMQQENECCQGAEDISSFESPEHIPKDYYKKIQDFDYLDTDSSSWGQSAASFMSWSDEIESATTEKVQELMDDIECILYDEPVKIPPNKEIIEECNLWKKSFPHMRVRGHAMKINIEHQKEHISTAEDNVEEIFAIDGAMDGAEEKTSFKVNRKETENLTTHFDKNYTQEVPENCSLEDMVKNYVVQQLSSYVWSEVSKKLAFSSVNYRTKSGSYRAKTDRKCEKLLDINKPTLTNVPSDKHSEINSTELKLFTSMHPNRGRVSGSVSGNSLGIHNDISSQSSFGSKSYRTEYPSFSVIGSAPVSLPPPRAVYSSAYETRAFHSAAERNKKQYADRRFSCGTASKVKTSDQFYGLGHRNERRTSSNYSIKSSKELAALDQPNTLNKHLVLPPINKVEYQKVSSLHRHNRFQRIDDTKFLKIYQELVAQEGIEKSPQIKKTEKHKKEQRSKKISYPERI